MLRFEVGEVGQPPLPAIDLDDAIITIGSGASARIRLPGAREIHVRIEGDAWEMDGERGVIGGGCALMIGNYRVKISRSPGGVAPTPPQRTESLRARARAQTCSAPRARPP